MTRASFGKRLVMGLGRNYPETPCAYAYLADHHSADRVTVSCGRPQPVTLCGYHASSPWLATVLAAISSAEKGEVR